MEIDTLAEVVHSFVDWVDTRVRNLPYPIYFLSRDGNVFKKLSNTNSQFLLVSRSALWKSSMFSVKDIYDYLNRYFGYIEKERVYNMFHIAEKDDSREIINEKNVFPFIDKYSNQIIEASFEHKKRLDKYLKNNDLKNKKIILVDVGYGATTQYLLSKHGVQSKGYYLATNNYNFHHIDTSNISTKGFLIEKRNDTHLFHMIMKNTNWLESIFIGDLMNTVNDFDEKGNPVFEGHSFPPGQFKQMLEYYWSILQYKPTGISNPAQVMFQFLNNQDFSGFQNWTRGKGEIRKSGLSFQPNMILFLSLSDISTSRFAESCFNARIAKTNLPYMADSRLLDGQNDKIIQPNTELFHLMKVRNIDFPSMYRKAKRIDYQDFEKYDKIICLDDYHTFSKKIEELIPHKKDNVFSWNLNVSNHFNQSLTFSADELERKVMTLIDQLRTENIPNPVEM